VADVFVIPTWREGFGMSIIEAQGLGLPVITSDAYGVVDASVVGKTGLRCKVGDVESLYQSMFLYHNNPKLRAEHGAAGRRRVEKLYDNKVVTQAWVEYYKTLLN
jgi:glycosyltransferase involved in cell wall biosynthesis